MGKVPKKKNLADKVRKAKTSTEIKNNPFEVKINRKKFDVLGRKTKHDVGLPGVSRSKAINKVRQLSWCHLHHIVLALQGISAIILHINIFSYNFFFLNI